MAGIKARNLIEVRSGGLYCPLGDFYVDPTRAVDRAVVTHGHSDHARAGHGACWRRPRRSLS